jgi:hypothetical protein
MVSVQIIFIDLSQDRSFVADRRSRPRPLGTSPNLVREGHLSTRNRQTANPASSGAQNPVVAQLKLWVVSLSPTFAGRDLTA